MTTHFFEEKRLPFPAPKIFDLVADVASYPDFLPWCLAARVRPQSPTLMHADLVVGYKAFREKYTSHVTLNPPERISVRLVEGPLTFLKTEWCFEPLSPDACQVSLELSFQFHSKIKQALMGALFQEAAQQMITAFEARARGLLG